MSGSKYDAVLSYHTNPLTCGVAKFNQQLAQRLGVPCVNNAGWPRHPLVSVKPSEIGDAFCFGARAGFDLLLHGAAPMRGIWPDIMHCADRVFHASAIGCPSTISGNPTRGTYRVLTFGMAHKRVLGHYAVLKEWLEREHPDYTVSLSTAIHEGTPWDEGLHQSEASLRALFGEKFRFLGFLADDALAKELAECHAVALYFDPALRKNNTSYWAAVAAGKPVFTNRDALSPQETDPPVTWATVLEALGA